MAETTNNKVISDAYSILNLKLQIAGIIHKIADTNSEKFYHALLVDETGSLVIRIFLNKHQPRDLLNTYLGKPVTITAKVEEYAKSKERLGYYQSHSTEMTEQRKNELIKWYETYDKINNFVSINTMETHHSRLNIRGKFSHVVREEKRTIYIIEDKNSTIKMIKWACDEEFFPVNITVLLKNVKKDLFNGKNQLVYDELSEYFREDTISSPDSLNTPKKMKLLKKDKLFDDVQRCMLNSPTKTKKMICEILNTMNEKEAIKADPLIFDNLLKYLKRSFQEEKNHELIMKSLLDLVKKLQETSQTAPILSQIMESITNNSEKSTKKTIRRKLFEIAELSDDEDENNKNEKEQKMET